MFVGALHCGACDSSQSSCDLERRVREGQSWVTRVMESVFENGNLSDSKWRGQAPEGTGDKTCARNLLK